MEEKIDALIESKKGLSDELLAGGDEINLTEMTNDDIMRMVSLDLHSRDEGVTLMSRDYGGWATYVSVAARRRKVEREMEKLRKKGVVVSPVKIEGRHDRHDVLGQGVVRQPGELSRL